MSELPDDYFEPAICKTHLPIPSYSQLESELSAMKQRAEAAEAAKESALELAAFRKEKLEAAEAALKPKPLSEGLVPHAYQLAATIQNADYWYKAGHEETNTSKAVMCMAQAMFAWKNAALAKAEDCLNYEARIKASQEQEPFMWITSSGVRIPDKNVQRELAIVNGWIACYTAPVIPPDVAELQRKVDRAHAAQRDAEQRELDCCRDLDVAVAENAELTRKLAMQQARLKQIYTLLRNEVSVALYYGMANINNANPESGSKLDETSKHLERVGDLVDEVLKHPTNEEELTKLLAEAKREAVPYAVTDNLQKILDWCEAYPPSVFPEPDFKRAASVLKELGMTLDAISASNMRHILNGVEKYAKAEMLAVAPSPETDIDREQRFK